MMTRALAFSLLLLGAGAARACLRLPGCLGTLLTRLLLCQNPLGSQVMVHILTRGSPLLLPKAMSQLLYLLFRGHGYLPHEELMRESHVLSRFWADFASYFFSLAREPIRGPQDVMVMINRQQSPASGGVARLMGQ
jgi:hypothetical protein